MSGGGRRSTRLEVSGVSAHFNFGAGFHISLKDRLIEVGQGLSVAESQSLRHSEQPVLAG